jgi:hypothetical protein
VVVFLVLAGSAVATTITSPTGRVATPAIKAESEGHIVLHNELAKIECASTIEGKVEKHGAGVTASGNISALSFTGCTNDWVVHVNFKGSLEVHWTSGYNGTVTSTGMKITATRYGVSCIYETSATDIGTITGGTPATLHLVANIPRVGGSFACGGSTAQLTGSYKVTSPSALLIDNSAVSVGGTIITSPTGTVATPTIKAESEGHVTLHNSILDLSCQSTLEGKIENHGEEASASGNLTGLSFTNCTEGPTVVIRSLGELSVDWTNGYNGTVTSTGATIIASIEGEICSYKTEQTHIGTITGGTPATMHLEASIPRHGGSVLCGESPAKLTGSYKVTTPTALFVDKYIAGTRITSPTGTVATPTINAQSEGHAKIHNSIVNIECTSNLEGKIENDGEFVSASGALSALSFTGCTNEWVVDVVSKGTLTVNWTSGYNGTVLSNGMTITATHAGLSCSYKTAETQIGTITGGAPATIHLAGVLQRHSGSFLCGGATSPLTGSLEVKSPSSLYVDKGS